MAKLEKRGGGQSGIDKASSDLQNQINDIKNKVNGSIPTYEAQVDFEMAWDGTTAKPCTIKIDQDGIYLVYMQAHIAGADSLPAGSYLMISGKGIRDYLQHTILLAKSWDKYQSSTMILSLPAGSYTYNWTGNFQGGKTNGEYISQANMSFYKIGER